MTQTKKLHAIFGYNKLKGNAGELLKQKTGVVFLNNTEYLTDKESWTRVYGIYTAQGGEDYVTIGTFNELLYLNLIL